MLWATIVSQFIIDPSALELLKMSQTVHSRWSQRDMERRSRRARHRAVVRTILLEKSWTELITTWSSAQKIAAT